MKPIQFIMGIFLILLMGGVLAIPSVLNAGITAPWNGTEQIFYVQWSSMGNITSNTSGYIFQWDNSGVGENDSWTPTIDDWSNITKTLNATPGMTIHWKVYMNDTSDEYDVYISSFSIVAPAHEVFSTAICPTDTLQTTLLYMFFGLLIIAGFWYSDSRNFGLGLIVVSLLTVFYSIPMFGCSLVWGVAILSAGLLMAVYAWKWKYY